MTQKQYKSFVQESILNIQETLDNNNLTVFAGASVSIDSNLPSWYDLIRDLKKSLDTNENDFLKVAELFFIQFKQNKYYKKINEYFPPNSSANIIHKKIISLNLNNLITTNWDDLFEKAIYSQGAFFDVIKDDSDIGNSSGFAKVIKMHGSLDKNNIVFKESDYLDYSSNFPLIENYVKSAFSTDTILLVGYSLSDINLKQIISWINLLSNNIKPIYFLKVNAEFDYLEFEYYKSKNIFVIYWNDNTVFGTNCCTMDTSILKLKGQMIYNFLDKISAKEINVENLSFKNIFLTLYDSLKILESYEYVMPLTVVNIVKKKFSLYGINEIFYEKDTITIQTKKLCKLFKFIKRLNNNKVYEFITNILVKTNIRFIKDMTKNIILYSVNTKDRDLVNYLYDFDFKSLEKELQEISFCHAINENEKLFLKKAYLLYQNRDFRESYEVLKEVSKVSFQNRKLDIWFIAEFNKKYFCNLMRSEKQYIKDDEYMKQVECYCKEIGKIDLQNYINKLPLKYQEILKPLYDFDSFLDKKLISSIYLVESLDKDLITWSSGGFSYNQNMDNVIQIWEEVEFFINSYYLTVEYDGRIKEIYQNIFKSVIINKVIKKDKNIVPFIISMGMRSCYQHKDLEDFLRLYLKDATLTLLDKENIILVILDNLILKIKDDKNTFCHYCTYFHKLLILLSYIIIDKTLFGNILEKFNELLSENYLNITDYEVINIFITRQYNNNKKAIYKDSLESIIKRYIYAFIDGKFSVYSIEALRHTILFNNIFNIVKNIDSKYILDDDKIITRFISNIKEHHIKTQSLIAKQFLIGIWFVGNSKIKDIVKEYYKYLETQKDIKPCDFLELKYIMVANDIDKNLKQELENDIGKYKQQYQDVINIESIQIMECIENIEKGLQNTTDKKETNQ